MLDQDVVTRLAAADPQRAGQSLPVEEDPRAATLLRTVLAGPGPVQRRLLGRRPHQPHISRRLVSIALTGVVVITAGVIVQQSAPPAPLTFVTTGPAHTALIAAAVRAEREPHGRIWRAEVESRETIHRNHNGNEYTVTASYPTTSQYNVETGEDRRTTDLGPEHVKFTPLTPADAAAYRRDGSPQSNMNLEAGFDVGVTFQTGLLSAGDFIFEGNVETLPSDPTARGEAMLDRVADGGGWTSRIGLTPRRPRNPEAWLFREGMRQLDAQSRPYPPKVRAQVFRMLAGIPGVRTMDEDHDPLGRPAVGLALTEQTENYGTLEWQVFLSPTSDLMMATQAVVVKAGRDNPGLPPGTVQYAELVKSADWD
jgi:hypothetical protein